jgi:hypothetical protein
MAILRTRKSLIFLTQRRNAGGMPALDFGTVRQSSRDECVLIQYLHDSE